MAAPDQPAASDSAFARQWSYRPPVPIRTSPLFAWPLRPAEIARWFGARWLSLAENAIVAVIATASFFLVQSTMEEARSLAPGWIFEIWLRNMVLMTVVAGGLHLWFHSWRRQEKKLKYDPREMPKSGGTFTFNSQLWDNVFWTLASGVTFWTAYEVLLFWAMANGYAPVLSPMDNPIAFALILLATPIWISFHFYWIHRALHWPPLYRLAHALHHRNTNVGPWSGMSMHPVEHLVFLSSVLIHFVVPAHPIHILFHMQHQALTGASSHTGYEAFLVKDSQWLALGTFHHQIHHRYFECNYGNLEIPWDRWFGSFHDGTDESHAAMKARRRFAAR